VMVVVAGAWWYWHSTAAAAIAWRPFLDRPISPDLGMAFGSGMIPVLFSYGGWQTANFVASEIRNPRKNLPRALLLGTLGVVALYVGVTFACMVVLGPDDLATTTTPASEIMQRVLGAKGAALIAVGISVSALGFLSQSVLTYPRVFFAMADDGLFPSQISRVNPRTRVPVMAILLASLLTVGVVLAGHYESILVYVESMDGLFLGLTALTLFVFRRRQRSEQTKAVFPVPGHPWSTGVFVAINWAVVANSFYRYRANALLILAILLAGVPLYFYWSRRPRQGPARMEPGSL
jgi:basic amino acid/polyamine antiporter, APA family